MTGQSHRLPEGGRIDRGQLLAFTFNGRSYEGYTGDTLASALLANDVRLVGRSFKYHRPRGIFGHGGEEPNALVQVGTGARTRPNVLATRQELYDGLVAASQNCWPSVGFDLGAAAGLFSAVLPSGFYYKTFMWPAAMWMTYERMIRHAAGMGRSPRQPDPDRYEKRHAHCDVLVVGAGPAGIAAASAAAASGARVMLVDEDSRLGGSLLHGRATIDGIDGDAWVDRATTALEAEHEVVILRRATAFGYYDDNLIAIEERVADHVAEPGPVQPRGRLWLVRASQVVLATGAYERPFVFADNDRPGIMLASAARAYVGRYAVRPGRRAVVFTNNDSAYDAAIDLAGAGVEIATIIDSRKQLGPVAEAALAAGIRCLTGRVVSRARGGRRLSGIDIMAWRDGRASGPSESFDCDLLAVSGGWSPAVHLFSQSRGGLRYDDGLTAFVPDNSPAAVVSAGACNGTYATQNCLSEGADAGLRAAVAAGYGEAVPSSSPVAERPRPTAPIEPVWDIEGGRGKRFVDLQNDVTAEDVALAAREGYISVEHLKRYTTLGMGTDQGRTSNVNGLAILAGLRDADIPAVGTTTFRPPFAPVSLGTLVGREVGSRSAPIRRTAMHNWHEEAGALFMPAGLWLRPRVYPRGDETVAQAARREAAAVRNSVGLVDISTLGKIDIQGSDAVELLERVYTNGWRSLKVGRSRYGLMLREDGMVFDDGTTTRIGEYHFYMTTTTANAAPVMRHLEHCLQVLWPDLDVHVVSVTEQWAGMAIAGPNARAVLAAVADGANVGTEAVPFLGYAEIAVAGIPARLFRISYSGELAYEVHVPADYGLAVWESFMDAGQPYDIVPYGPEAMTTLRMEKGHIVTGGEIDGRTTADDLGLGRMVSARKDFIGKRALERPALAEPGRKQLVGLLAADGVSTIPGGAQIVADPDQSAPNRMLGHVTVSAFSPAFDQPMALGLLVDGRERHGETLHALSPITRQRVAVIVADPVFVDAEGERMHG